jgi:hypothetical protein
MRPACEHKLLAACDICTVEQCRESGVVHLHLGATSVRLKAPAFMVLVRTLMAALPQLEPQDVAILAAWPRSGEGQH